METREVVHEHHSDHGGNFGMIIGLVILAIVILAVFYYGLPALNGGGQTQVNAPDQVSVPEQVDVNVNPGQ